MKTTTKKTMSALGVLAAAALAVTGCSADAQETATATGQSRTEAPVEMTAYWAAHDNGVLEMVWVSSEDSVNYQMMQCHDGRLVASDPAETSFGTFDDGTIDFGDSVGHFGHQVLTVEQTDDGGIRLDGKDNRGGEGSRGFVLSKDLPKDMQQCIRTAFISPDDKPTAKTSPSTSGDGASNTAGDR